MMEAYSTIFIQSRGPICDLWLARPEKRNAINRDMATELVRALEDIAHDPEIRVVILRGKGNMFCAGGDLEWMSETAGSEKDHPPKILSKLFRAFYEFPKPLIAMVHGKAMGGAMGMIAAADFVVATRDAGFAFSEVRLGLVPATISPFVIRRCGEYRSMQLMLSGALIPAARAKEAGLADILVDADQAENEIGRLSQELSSNAPEAMMSCKKLVRKVADHPMNGQLFDFTGKVLDQVRNTDEAKEGIRAFREKREPYWKK